MIIDAHMHLGEDLIFNTDDSEEDILGYMRRWGIDGAILQTGIMPRDPRKANERIARLAQKYPGKFWGIAVLSPYVEEEEYFEFMRWAIQDLGFKAIKLQPFAFCASPLSPQARKVFTTADKLGVPVMIHTGNGVPVALPSLAIPIARKYPDMKIVLAHSGAGMYGDEALVAATVCPNIYLETSWANVASTGAFVKELGSERVMFGCDLPSNAGAELGKYQALDLTPEEYAQCYEGTARAVFNL